jgi:hypothetical protein
VVEAADDAPSSGTVFQDQEWNGAPSACQLQTKKLNVNRQEWRDLLI